MLKWIPRLLCRRYTNESLAIDPPDRSPTCDRSSNDGLHRAQDAVAAGQAAPASPVASEVATPVQGHTSPESPSKIASVPAAAASPKSPKSAAHKVTSSQPTSPPTASQPVSPSPSPSGCDGASPGATPTAPVPIEAGLNVSHAASNSRQATANPGTRRCILHGLSVQCEGARRRRRPCAAMAGFSAGKLGHRHTGG